MIVLIDNYDSFTYNLLHYIGELGKEVHVVRNDQISVPKVQDMQGVEAIIISPGPCTPDDSGICLELIQAMAGKLPILGVCLGHEAIGQVFGGDIIHAGQPVHGKTSPIIHNGKGLFQSLANPFNATRYHSLVINPDTLPDCLEVTARTEDNIIMAIQHKTYDIYGVQFHPESIASEHGHDILRNFLNLIDK